VITLVYLDRDTGMGRDRDSVFNIASSNPKITPPAKKTITGARDKVSKLNDSNIALTLFRFFTYF
jgi:hypothetical protein